MIAIPNKENDMGVILKVYATVLIMLWVSGLACLLFDKLESKAYDIIATAMGMLIGIGIIGLIIFVFWSLWNL